jgi:hypothetical protein
VTRLVADASAIVDLLAGAPTAGAIAEALAAFPEIDVPEHFHVEALSALRGMLLRGDLAADRQNGHFSYWPSCASFATPSNHSPEASGRCATPSPPTIVNRKTADVLRVETKKVLMFEHDLFEDFLDFSPGAQQSLALRYCNASDLITTLGWDPENVNSETT